MLLRGETDNEKSYAFATDILPGRNMITTAFSGNANTIDNWIKEKVRRPQSAAANSAQAVEFYPSGQQAFDDIINRIQSNVKDAPGGMLEGGAAISTRLRRQYVDELKERGISEKDANKMIDAVAEISRNKDEVSQTFDAVLSDQLDMGQYPNGNYDDAQKVWASIAQDAVAAARADVDIRQAVKDRTQGVDERTQNIVADSMQAFADRAADDFGITQREVLERTGLRINAENAPRTFDDGSRINENGEFVDADGNVLFQSAMYRNKRTDVQDFAQYALDNPSNKQSYQVFEKNGVQFDLTTDTINHDSRRHSMSAADWVSVINSLDNITHTETNKRKNSYGSNNIILETKDGDKEWRIIITQNGGRNRITSAFELGNARVPNRDLKKMGKATNAATGIISGHDAIIEQLRSYVKAIPDKNTDSAWKVYHQDGKLDIRGYFDWSNKMQQIIQIMKTGDLDTVLHELGFDCVTLPRILEQEQIDIARSMIPIVDIDRKLYRLIDCINNMRYDFKDGVMDTKHVVHDEYSHGAKAFMYMCQSIYKNRDEKREYTEQERREKMQQAMLDDIRRGLEANRRQLSDTEDLTRVAGRESYWIW